MIIKKQIPDEFANNGIRWLGAERADGGFYLYQYEDEFGPCKWDAYYGDLDDLIKDCSEIWNLNENDWPEVATLK